MYALAHAHTRVPRRFEKAERAGGMQCYAGLGAAEVATTPDSQRGGSLRFRWRPGQHVLVGFAPGAAPPPRAEMAPADRNWTSGGHSLQAGFPPLCPPHPVLRPCA